MAEKGWGEGTEANPYKCFVIGPIGEEDSELRKHAKAVHNLIINEAIRIVRQENGVHYLAQFSHERLRVGKVVEDVIDAILKDRIIIAILSFARPNVYYELGIAHAAGRAVILLISDTEPELPFDIRGLDHIRYHYDPLALVSGQGGEAAPARKLAGLIQKLHEEKKAFGRPFGDPNSKLQALGQQHVHLKFWPYFRELPLKEVVDICQRARNFVIIAEPALEMLRSYPDRVYDSIIRTLRERAAHGCQITILYSRPIKSETPADGEKIGVEFDFEKANHFIERVRADLERLEREEKAAVIELQESELGDRLLVTDSEALIVKRFTSIDTHGLCPALLVSAEPNTEYFALYEAVLKDLGKHAAKHKKGWNAAPSRPLTVLDMRLSVFHTAARLVNQARKFVFVLEPSYSLFARHEIADEDEVVAAARAALLLRLEARAIDRGCNVVMISYDTKNSLYHDELRRVAGDRLDHLGLERAQTDQLAWAEKKREWAEKLDSEGTAPLNFRIFKINRSVISERILMTDHEVLVVPLIGRIGVENCDHLVYGAETPEHRRIRAHIEELIVPERLAEVASGP